METVKLSGVTIILATAAPDGGISWTSFDSGTRASHTLSLIRLKREETNTPTSA